MTVSANPDVFTACHHVAHTARSAFECTIAVPRAPHVESIAARDAEFSDPGWMPGVGTHPLGITTLLLSGAASVLDEFGEVIAAARGPVVAPTMVRYVVEHVAEVLWLLEPGTHDPDTTTMTVAEQVAAAHAARLTRVRRAALRTYGWTLDFENGRAKAKPGEERPAGLPRTSSDDLERILEPHGLVHKRSNTPPSTMDPARKWGPWKLDGATDISMTEKVKNLTDQIETGREAHHAGLYAFLSTSAHPNPFAVSEVGGSGRFERHASEMGRFMTIAGAAVAFGLRLVATYAGWPTDDVEILNDDLDALAALVAEADPNRRP